MLRKTLSKSGERMFPDSMKALIAGCSGTWLYALSTLLILAWPSAGWPCSCAPQERRQFDPLEAPLSFVGQVATVERLPVDPKGDPTEYNKVCLDSEFAIWGVAANTRRVCVVTRAHSDGCGVPFEVGEHYVVYADKSKDIPADAGLPYTHKCFGTALVRRDLAPPSTPPFLPVALASSVAGFAMGLLVRGRRRKTAMK